MDQAELICELIDFLKINDEYFLKYWNKVDNDEKDKLVKTISKISTQIPCADQHLKIIHYASSLCLRNIFSRIQTLNFNYMKVPGDWDYFVNSKDDQTEVYKRSYQLLSSFIREINVNESVYQFYGGIKPNKSLRRKKKAILSSEKIKYPIYDLIRFRVITNDIASTLYVSQAIWELWFEKIVRCRNYFFWPKRGQMNSPYRSIHFIIETVNNRHVEIQILTKLREFLSYLDHYIYYRKRFKELHRKYGKYLKETTYRTTIYETSNFFNNNKSILQYSKQFQCIIRGIEKKCLNCQFITNK